MNSSLTGRSEREVACFNQANQLFNRIVCISSNFIGIGIKTRVVLKFFEIENLIRKVWLYEHIYVEVDIAEYVAVKRWWCVDIAVKAF